MTHVRRAIAAVVLLCGSLVPATPQNPEPGTASSTGAPQSASGSASPVLKVTTRLVEMNVVVHDRHGQPVSDLTKDDFIVTDQGKPQSISLFRMDAAGPTPAAAAQLMPRNEFSNRVDRQSQIPTSATVVLMDFLNTHFADQSRARLQVLKFLRQIQPQDRVALYSLVGGGIRVIHDFTNNSETLVTALAKAMPDSSSKLTASERDEEALRLADQAGGEDSVIGRGLLNSIESESSFFTRDRVISTCAVLKTLADHLSGLPGRKNLVWVSGGFPISFGFGDPAVLNPIENHFSETYGSYIEATSRAMNTANVAVYPVDARGLFGLPLFDASRDIRMQAGRPRPEYTQIDQRNVDTMIYVARLTGGRAFYNSNDIEGAIRKAIDDSAVTYTVGYYSDEENWDDKFHHIKVKVRRPGLDVRTKKGYYARERLQPSSDELAHATFDAIWSPLDASSIGLRAHIDPSPELPNASRIVMRLTAQDIQFGQKDGRLDASIDMIFVQLTHRGKRLADERKTLALNLKPATYQKIMHEGLFAGGDLRLNNDTESIRVVVVDRNSGSVGTLTVPVAPEDKSRAAAATPGTQPTPQK